MQEKTKNIDECMPICFPVENIGEFNNSIEYAIRERKKETSGYNVSLFATNLLLYEKEKAD
jgi:hypothetical protein